MNFSLNLGCLCHATKMKRTLSSSIENVSVKRQHLPSSPSQTVNVKLLRLLPLELLFIILEYLPF